MSKIIPFTITPQPTETTCGPTVLHATYQYYQDPISLHQLISEIPSLEGGGTLGVNLGLHALKRNYQVELFTYNLTLFDPTWFKKELNTKELMSKLKKQALFKEIDKLRMATTYYLEFLEKGGKISFKDLTKELLIEKIEQGYPILTGLSSTYLYDSAREYGPNCDWDDVKGEPQGHFVVLTGYDSLTEKMIIADPLSTNPKSKSLVYSLPIQKVVGAILLGIITYDANLLIIKPKKT